MSIKTSPEKFTLISLLVLTEALCLSALALLYLVPLYGFKGLHPFLPQIMGVLMGGAGAAVFIALSLLSLSTL